jgi:hypothetical protein
VLLTGVRIPKQVGIQYGVYDAWIAIGLSGALVRKEHECDSEIRTLLLSKYLRSWNPVLRKGESLTLIAASL